MSRIRKAIQHLGEAVPAEEYETAPAIDVPPMAVNAVPVPEAAPATPLAPQSPHAAPEEPSAESATRVKKAPVAATTQNTVGPREGSKTSQVIAMLKREGGATLEEIMRAMGWQKHTTRAMLSAGGSLTKNHRLIVSSEKVGDQRKYFLTARSS